MKRTMIVLLVILLACSLSGISMADEVIVDIQDQEEGQEALSLDEAFTLDEELILDADLDLESDEIIQDQEADVAIDDNLSNLFQDRQFALLDDSGYHPGYASVPKGTVGYADIELTRPEGMFTDDSCVWADTFEILYGAARVCFDTESARSGGDSPKSCYIRLNDLWMLDDQEAAALAQRLAESADARNIDGIWMPMTAFDTSSTGALNGSPVANSTTTELDSVYHTQAEIQAFVDAHPAYRYQPDIFAVGATKDPYRPARLSGISANAAIAMVNQMRFIAGLDANVVFDWDREETISAAALINSLNNRISHEPARPSVLASSAYDSLFALAKEGAGSSNLASGIDATGSVPLYMSDRGLPTVGHRLWVLSPAMGKTAFGSCAWKPDAHNVSTAMYAFDTSGTVKSNTVAWPAREMPVQYFNAGDYWSFSWVHRASTPTSAGVNVTLTRLSDGRVWSISEASPDGELYIGANWYGHYDMTLTFLPNGLTSISAGDVFDVTITDSDAGETVSYTVRFFDLDLGRAQGFDQPDVVALIRDDGNHVTWGNVAGASKYIICRSVNDNGPEYYDAVVANQAAYEYLDRNVGRDAVYTYAVYAANDYMTGNGGAFTAIVPPEPSQVWLEDIDDDLPVMVGNPGVPNSIQLTAGLTPAYAETTLTWVSSKPNVATVDANGLVTPLDEGWTEITVQARNGVSDSIWLSFYYPQPDAIGLNQAGPIELVLGHTIQLAANLTPAYAKSSITWMSSDDDVATVLDQNDTAIVTAVNAGSAIISATTDNGLSASIVINTVAPPPDAITITEGKRATLYMGRKLTLHTTLHPDNASASLTWKSSKPGIATVSKHGKVTPRKAGKTKITVQTDNGKKASIVIKVVDAKRVKLREGKKVTLKAGKKLTLHASVSPNGVKTRLTWKSSNPKVATVSSKGVVTAKRAGQAYITVKTANNKTATIVITVK